MTCPESQGKITREPGVAHGYPDTQATSPPGRTTAEAEDALRVLLTPRLWGPDASLLHLHSITQQTEAPCKVPVKVSDPQSRCCPDSLLKARDGLREKQLKLAS